MHFKKRERRIKETEGKNGKEIKKNSISYVFNDY